MFNNETMSKDFVSGSGAGLTVAALTFPLEAWKKYKAAGLDKSAKEFKPYRGFLVFAANVVPTTGIQLMTDGALKDYTKESAPLYSKLLASAYCGAQGAVAATFVENSVIRQQVTGWGPKETLKDMFAQGYLRPWKSFPLIAGRDSIFTLCMLQFNPAARQYAKKHFPENPSYEFLASLGVGFSGAFLSHPLDTMASRMQMTHQPMSIRGAAKDVMTHLGGYKGFYTAFPYRLALFFSFSNIIPYIKKEIDERYFPKIKELEAELTGKKGVEILKTIENSGAPLTFQYAGHKGAGLNAKTVGPGLSQLPADEGTANKAKLPGGYYGIPRS